MPIPQKSHGQMKPDEPCRARDEYPHFSLLVSLQRYLFFPIHNSVWLAIVLSSSLSCRITNNKLFITATQHQDTDQAVGSTQSHDIADACLLKRQSMAFFEIEDQLFNFDSRRAPRCIIATEAVRPSMEETRPDPGTGAPSKWTNTNNFTRSNMSGGIFLAKDTSLIEIYHECLIFLHCHVYL